MKEILNKKIYAIPVYGYITGIGLFILQRMLYLWANDISYFFKIPWRTTKFAWIDEMIPLVPIFISVYILSYLYWIIGPMVVSKCEKSHFKDFVVGMLVALFIGALIFTVYPTRMDRVAENLLNDHPGILNYFLQMIYHNDGYQYGTNLFPSYHCLISACCYLGVRHRSEISKSYQWFCAIFNILIYASTVFCKQHYFLDIPSGILIAYVSMHFAMKYHWGRIIR